MKKHAQDLAEAFEKYVNECNENDSFMFMLLSKEDNAVLIESQNTQGLFPLFNTDLGIPDEYIEKLAAFNAQVSALILLSLTKNKGLRDYFRQTINTLDQMDEIIDTMKKENPEAFDNKTDLESLN